jgi:hypothetical protein
MERNEQFSITSQVHYTIHTVDGQFTAVGVQGLKSYADDIMGGFIDRMRSSRPENTLKAAMHDHEYLKTHRKELQLIYAMIDEIENIVTPCNDHDCNDYYCNRCGTSSGIEFCG